MDGLSVLIGMGSGVLLTAAVLWVLLRGQAEAGQRLQAQLAEREAELSGLREELRRELEQRAKAEEKARQASALAEQLRAAQDDNARLRDKVSVLSTQLGEERKQAEEKLRLLNDAREQLTAQFRNLANEILEDKSKRFTDQNKTNLEGLLTPLKEQLKDFEKKVHEVYDKETRDRVSLFNEITRLKELNQRISEDAVNLTRALKGESKTQGIWGEMILEQLLEKSGLTKGREYEVQASFTSDDGRRQQPDVIVKLPEGKHVIIDSKVSLTAYERFCSATDEAERLAALKDHCTSLRNHCRGLSAKAYEQLGIRTLDYVLLFVPVEPAYIEAVRHDAALFGDALDKNIIIATPSTLLAMLRTIHNIWRFEYQNRHAAEIAEKAGRLYDKFVGFVADLDEVGRRLEAAQKAHDEAFKKLTHGRGNLVKTADDIKTLGAKAAKSLPVELVEEAAEEQPLLQLAETGGD